MSTIVNLADLAESLECQSDEMPAYINRLTGKIEMISTELLEAIENGDDPVEAVKMYGGGEEDIALATEIAQGGDWLPLPSKFDINDYSIMQDYGRSQESAELRSIFENAIRGSGAFGRFRAAVERAGQLEQWYAFKNQKYKEIAKEWCEENGIEVEVGNKNHN